MTTIIGSVSVQSSPAPVQQSIAPIGWNINGFFFDAWLELNHESVSDLTHHPVQTGAQISDNAIMQPLQFSFLVGMTDTVAAITGNFSNIVFSFGNSRSVNAYRTIVAMQQQLGFVTLNTKYGTYQNVFIKRIMARDDSSTQNASKMQIDLEQPSVVGTQNITVSSNPQVTNQTNLGAQSVLQVPQNIQQAIQAGNSQILQATQ